MSWKSVFDKEQELVLATCSKNCQPHANLVISLGFVGNKLLIADCQMKTTLKNLKELSSVCIVAKKKGEYYRLKGKVEIFSSGKYFDLCNKASENYPAKNAILVNIKEVFDLDKVKKIL
jgi:uncharacterized pyridoxamine 5'-phosphate oxidase family protein